jgi:hypothetical protein
MCYLMCLYYNFSVIYQYIIDLVIIKNLDPKMVFIIYAPKKALTTNGAHVFKMMEQNWKPVRCHMLPVGSVCLNANTNCILLVARYRAYNLKTWSIFILRLNIIFGVCLQLNAIDKKTN